MSKVVVLGAGPAGLMAAHAALIAGHQVRILSKKRKSYMRGAQYLHAPIPMTPAQMFKVTYDLHGSVDGYREKVYGPDPRIKVSPESLVGEHLAWDIRKVYDALWIMYGDNVVDTDFRDAQHVAEMIDGEEIVISSIPANLLCSNPAHTFSAERVWVTEMFRPESDQDNLVICSGNPDDPWYRSSRILGWENTEYPDSRKPPLSSDKVHEVLKPILTTCDCLPHVRRVGRYGTWTKGVLSHEAYYDTFAALSQHNTKEHNQ